MLWSELRDESPRNCPTVRNGVVQLRRNGGVGALVRNRDLLPARFYDQYLVTDDVLRTINWVFLVFAFHAFRFRNVHDRRDAILLGYGFGAIMIVLWEMFDWVVSEDGFGGAGGLQLTYRDTIGDLALSSTGGLVGSVVGMVLLGPVATHAARS